uniref:RRM domain-containing protein n=1 Tax=Panagrolaimus superbus TaxID=310955 RepID=A0A914ZE94_9BILA
MEIFGLYGTIKDARLPTNYHHPNFCRGDATIVYENHDDAEKALRHMDGGQIDGLIISCEWVLPTPPRPVVQRGRSPIRGRSPRRSPRRNFGGRRSRSPFRGGRMRRSRSPVRRSRSPIRGGRSPPRRFRRSPSPGRRSPRRSSPKRKSPPRRGTGGNMIPLGTRRRSPSP